MSASSQRPLSALLSQTLVAFTIELDNQFEKRMIDSGYPVAGISLVVWLTALGFIARAPLSVAALTDRSVLAPEAMKHILACLERWHFITFTADDPIPVFPHPRAKRNVRDGFGSSRNVRGDWIVRLTAKGAMATEIWEPLPAEIEQRWRERNGNKQIENLRTDLSKILTDLKIELPHGFLQGWRKLPPDTVRRDLSSPPLAVLLSQSLLLFKLEFDREAPAPFELSANILRVIPKEGVKEADIPLLTGCSPETSGIGWQVKKFVAVKQNKTICLTPLGLNAQKAYTRLVGEIELRWESRFGKKEIQNLRDALENLFATHGSKPSLIAASLVPPPGVVRSGRHAAPLGVSKPSPVSVKRCREIARQNEAFLSAPANRLPHCPLWDMNRGFGP